MQLSGCQRSAQCSPWVAPIGVGKICCRLNRRRRCGGELTSDGKADRFYGGICRRVSNLHRGRDICVMLRPRYQNKPERAKIREKERRRYLLPGKEKEFMANKEKMAVWLYPETKELVKDHMKQDNASSMSEFIEDAIRYYCGHLDCNTVEATTFLSSAVHTIIDSCLKGSEQRISRLLFKVAVEIAKLCNVLAYANEIDDEMLDSLQSYCVNEVRKINGIIQFEDAHRYQNS